MKPEPALHGAALILYWSSFLASSQFPLCKYYYNIYIVPQSSIVKDHLLGQALSDKWDINFNNTLLIVILWLLFRFSLAICLSIYSIVLSSYLYSTKYNKVNFAFFTTLDFFQEGGGLMQLHSKLKLKASISRSAPYHFVLWYTSAKNRKNSEIMTIHLLILDFENHQKFDKIVNLRQFSKIPLFPPLLFSPLCQGPWDLAQLFNWIHSREDVCHCLFGVGKQILFSQRGDF